MARRPTPPIPLPGPFPHLTPQEEIERQARHDRRLRLQRRATWVALFLVQSAAIVAVAAQHPEWPW